ncbi:protein POOR HOMOLOGOUS SYNAPSIS 1 [Jatropha curcas]|uniref:protein POOR HOMOLOGOUS SYNAPSIS 1 n=1 Tax=Jatropha curcas TaxID=180498 RepID=UPI0009D77AA9|nr:protein POOR HOMOLOGOUS SYNAPSIS 1 [Jatropha curcas]
MAGNQPLQNSKRGILEPVKELWQIHYSRFFSFPRLSSTCAILKPLSSRCIKKNPHGLHGKWVSSSSMASLHLKNDYADARGFVLVVSFQGKVYEEHHIAKLNFSWPQVSCLDECPIRGSRVVFASYRDSLGQVQKFAMRFSSSSDSQTFVNSLKESLKDVRNIRLTNRTFGLKKTSSSKHISTKAIHERHVEELSNVNPVGNYGPVIQPMSNNESIYPGNPVLADGSQTACAPLPSSFTAFLLDSCTVAEEEELPKASNEAFYLNTQVKSMTDYSFHSMLMKLEMVIDELGGDLAL